MAKFISSAEQSVTQRTGTVVHFEIKAADFPVSVAGQNVEFLIPIKAGTIVHEVGVILTENFNDPGTITFMIYDTAAAGSNDYIPSQSIKTGAGTAVITSRTVSGGDYPTGKYYASDTNLTVRVVPNTGGATTGVLKGFVRTSNVKLDGIKASLTVEAQNLEV
jgi:hypothetical protein